MEKIDCLELEALVSPRCPHVWSFLVASALPDSSQLTGSVSSTSASALTFCQDGTLPMPLCFPFKSTCKLSTSPTTSPVHWFFLHYNGQTFNSWRCPAGIFAARLWCLFQSRSDCCICNQAKITLNLTCLTWRSATDSGLNPRIQTLADIFSLCYNQAMN